MVTRSRAARTQGGFTLLEMLVVMCILICLMALLIPQLRPILEKKDQMRALNECKAISDALMQYVYLRGGSAGPDNPVDLASYPDVLIYTDLVTLLSPDFLYYVPEFDPWGSAWQITLANATDPDPSLPAPNFNVNGPRVYLVRSLGQNGADDGGGYEPGPFALNQDPSLLDPFGDDVVCGDGTLIRWPGEWRINP
jgi:type II secretory pathway pseudopilin PulG